MSIGIMYMFSNDTKIRTLVFEVIYRFSPLSHLDILSLPCHVCTCTNDAYLPDF